MVTAIYGKHLIRLVLSGILLLTSSLAHSEIKTATVTVNVTVFAPLPCILNGSKVAEVNFGNDIMIKKIDGKNYTKPIPFDLVCFGNKNAMKFQIRGTRASFGGNNTLETSNPNLGISINIKGFNVSVPINSDVLFTYPKTLPLQAVLVKKPGSTLSSGIFSSGAIIIISYQ
ncbi:fimbrial protein [Yersinia ruckeri]|nr:fimbrial protein [Yersinia ruckeri]